MDCDCQKARSAYTLQHTPPGLAIADLQPVAFQFEGTRLVSVGVIRRQAALDMNSHHVLLCVHGVGAEVGEIVV